MSYDIQQSQKTYIDIGNDNWIARDKIVALRVTDLLFSDSNRIAMW